MMTAIWRYTSSRMIINAVFALNYFHLAAICDTGDRRQHCSSSGKSYSDGSRIYQDTGKCTTTDHQTNVDILKIYFDINLLLKIIYILFLKSLFFNDSCFEIIFAPTFQDCFLDANTYIFKALVDIHLVTMLLVLDFFILSCK